MLGQVRLPAPAAGVAGTAGLAAILLAAFEQYNLKPGPLLFSGSSTLVWGLIASLYIGNVMLLVPHLPLLGLWGKLLPTPPPLTFQQPQVGPIISSQPSFPSTTPGIPTFR